MNTYFRKFKTLALGTMADDALKVDVNDFYDVLHVCEFVRWK